MTPCRWLPPGGSPPTSAWVTTPSAPSWATRSWARHSSRMALPMTPSMAQATSAPVVAQTPTVRPPDPGEAPSSGRRAGVRPGRALPPPTMPPGRPRPGPRRRAPHPRVRQRRVWRQARRCQPRRRPAAMSSSGTRRRGPVGPPGPLPGVTGTIVAALAPGLRTAPERRAVPPATVACRRLRRPSRPRLPPPPTGRGAAASRPPLGPAVGRPRPRTPARASSSSSSSYGCSPEGGGLDAGSCGDRRVVGAIPGPWRDARSAADAPEASTTDASGAVHEPSRVSTSPLGTLERHRPSARVRRLGPLRGWGSNSGSGRRGRR